MATAPNGQWGWGEPITAFFDASRINVVNRAVGGLSSRTYLTQGHWERVLACIEPGDFVIMQFGHNDGGPLDDADPARGTLKGIGPETREIDNPITKQHEVVHTYGWYLRQFMSEARAKGATPIVCSPIPRKMWKGGKIVRNNITYGEMGGEVARRDTPPSSISTRSSRAATMRWGRKKSSRCSAIPTPIPAAPARN